MGPIMRTKLNRSNEKKGAIYGKSKTQGVVGKNKTLCAMLLLFVLVLMSGCDPSATEHYRFRNETSSSIKYKLYWRSHNLYEYTDSLESQEEREVLSNDIMGFSNNEFMCWAETLYVNDSIRIIPCDITMFITNNEDDAEGTYTLIFTDSLLKRHMDLESKYGDSIFDCYNGYWK